MDNWALKISVLRPVTNTPNSTGLGGEIEFLKLVRCYMQPELRITECEVTSKN